MFELYEATDRANKSALILVRDRYAAQLAPFVKRSAQRLTYVSDQIDEIIVQAVEELGAEFDYVKSNFESYLAEVVLDTTPPKEDLSYKTPGEGLPPEKNETNDPLGDLEDDDVQNAGEVPGAGTPEALEPDARVDLGQDTLREPGDSETKGQPYTRRSCFRCEKKLDEKVANVTPVCADCHVELKKLAEGYEYPSTININDPIVEDDVIPADPNAMPYRCTLCDATGTREEVTAHVQQDHPDALQRKQEELMGRQQEPVEQTAPAPLGSKKADVPDQTDPERAEVQPLPQTPADNFDDVIQDLADRAAAEKLSMASEQDIHSIASELGLPEDEVRNSLVVATLVGNYHASNGRLSDTTDAPDGYQEVPVQSAGGRIDSHEALVPVDVVVNKVADTMNMEPNLVYNMVRDRYGAELPDKYHASVSGERHYYLPQELAAQMQQQQQPEQVDPNVGPTAPPAPDTEPQPQQQF